MVRASGVRVRKGSGNRRVRKNGQTMNQFLQVTLLDTSASSHLHPPFYPPLSLPLLSPHIFSSLLHSPLSAPIRPSHTHRWRLHCCI